MHKAKKLFIAAILLITLITSYICIFHLNRFSFGNDQYTRLNIILAQQPRGRYFLDLLIRTDEVLHEENWTTVRAKGPHYPAISYFLKAQRISNFENHTFSDVRADEFKITIVNEEGQLFISNAVKRVLHNGPLLLTYPAMNVYSLIPLHLFLQWFPLLLMAVSLELLLLQVLDIEVKRNLKLIILTNLIWVSLCIALLSLVLYQVGLAFTYVAIFSLYPIIGVLKLRKYRSHLIVSECRSIKPFVLLSLVLCFPYVLISMNIFHFLNS